MKVQAELVKPIITELFLYQSVKYSKKLFKNMKKLSNNER